MVVLGRMYSREPSPIRKGLAIPSNVEVVNVLYQERGVILDQLQKNLAVAQERMKKQANRQIF